MALLCLSISSSFAQDHSTCALADALTIGGTMCVDENGSGPNSGDPTGFDNTDGNVCSSNYSGGDDYIFSYTATSADGLQQVNFAWMHLWWLHLWHLLTTNVVTLKV